MSEIKINYCDLQIDLANESLRNSIRSLRNSYGIIILNLILCIWFFLNIYYQFNYIEWVIWLSLGAVGTSTLWIWLISWDTRIDVKLIKEKLKLLESLKACETTGYVNR